MIRKIFSFFGVCVFFSLFLEIQVEARELATCTYMFVRNDENISILLTVHDDNTISGFTEYSGITFDEDSLNGLVGEIYDVESGQLIPSCPKINACKKIGSDRVSIQTYACIDGEETLVTGEGVFNNISGTVEGNNQSQTFCTRPIEDELGNYIYITFATTGNGTKQFKISNAKVDANGDYYNADDGVWTNYGQEQKLTSGSVDRFYSVGTDVYWDSSSCKNVEIYMAYGDVDSEGVGDAHQFIITNVKPEETISGTPDDSNGFYDDPISNNGNGEFNPNNICKDGNCDPSLETFCEQSTVARTMKFIGMAFFILKILVPAVIIIMGIVNLFKIITSGKEDDAKKYAKIVVRNVLIGVVIFLVPGIINFVFTTVDDIVTPESESTISNCVNCLLDPTGSCEVP